MFIQKVSKYIKWLIFETASPQVNKKIEPHFSEVSSLKLISRYKHVSFGFLKQDAINFKQS